jgi:CRISPR-associated endoribonuclease Cas6
MKIYEFKSYFYAERKEIVPFNHSQILLSFFHNKVLGKNNTFHDDISLYSFSPLLTNKKQKTKEGNIYYNGAVWLIRTISPELCTHILKQYPNLIDQELGHGLVLKNIELKTISSKNLNKLNNSVSPVFLLKDKKDIIFSDDKSVVSELLKSTLLTKAKKNNIDLNPNSFTINFDYDNKLTNKRIRIGEKINNCSVGKINIEGNTDAIGLALGCGVGVSSGCGFGFVYN